MIHRVKFLFHTFIFLLGNFNDQYVKSLFTTLHIMIKSNGSNLALNLGRLCLGISALMMG